MIKYFRGLNAGVVDYLYPHLLPDEGIPVETFAAQLGAALKQTKEQVLVYVAYDDEAPEDQSLRGFLIAFVFPHLPFTYISQCTVLLKENWEPVADTLYFNLTSWTESLGRTRVQMDTNRDPFGVTDRFGFKPISQRMQLDLSDDLERVVAERIARLLAPKEQGNNGISRRHLRGEHEVGQLSNGTAEEPSEPDLVLSSSGIDSGEVPSSILTGTDGIEDRQGTDTLPGSDRTEPDPAVRPSHEPDIEQLAEQIRERNAGSGE